MEPHYIKNMELETNKSIGFFKRLFGRKDPLTRKTIKILKKELSSAKIDLYKIKNDTILTPVAKILYEIYKLTFPIKQFLPLDKSKKRFPPSFEEEFILSFISEEALEIYKKLNEDNIKQLIQKYGVNKTQIYIDKILNEYLDYFSKEKIIKINRIFMNLLHFSSFINFDFFPILREFDQNLEEGNFARKPSFFPAEGVFLRDDFHSLHKALFSFDADEKLDEGLNIYKKIKGFSPIEGNNLLKLKHLINDLQKYNYTALIVRAIDKNIAPLPFEKPQIIDLFNTHSLKIKSKAFSSLNAIKSKMKENSVNSIVSQLFKQPIIGRVKNYNEINNEQFKSHGISIFEYTKPLNYLKAFITDNYKVFVGKIANELIISGIFVNKSILNTLSNSYYALNNLIYEINNLDDDLDIEGHYGKTIKRLLYSLTKDISSRNILERNIQKINLRAKLSIYEGIVSIKTMAISIKRVLEDYKQKNPNIVSNIKKIRANNNKQFIQELVKSYKDIYLFLKLISNFITIKVTETDVEKLKKEVAEEKVMRRL